MDMIRGKDIAAANLTEWRQLAQGVYTRYLIDDFATGARLLAAIGDAGDEVGKHVRVTMGDGFVDLKLISTDAIYRDDEGTEHIVDWVTQADIDLARRITEIAAEQGLRAEPESVVQLEIMLGTANSAPLGRMWSVLLTGGPDGQGLGTGGGDDVRDADDRVPNLCFMSPEDNAPPQSRFQLEIWLPYEVVADRIAAAVAAGAVIVKDDEAPGHTVLADQDGNTVWVATFPPTSE